MLFIMLLTVSTFSEEVLKNLGVFCWDMLMSIVLEVIQTRGTDYVLDYSYMSTKIEEWIKSGLIPKDEAYKVCQCINSLRN